MSVAAKASPASPTTTPFAGASARLKGSPTDSAKGAPSAAVSPASAGRLPAPTDLPLSFWGLGSAFR
jgi:hypothetical protein